MRLLDATVSAWQADARDYVVRAANSSAPIEMTISAAAAFNWFDIVLLSDQRCSWDNIDPDIEAIVKSAAQKNNVGVGRLPTRCLNLIPAPFFNPPLPLGYHPRQHGPQRQLRGCGHQHPFHPAAGR